MATYRSVVYVQYKSGSKASGIKVQLGFSGLLSGGMTSSYYTDSSGRAIVEHSSRGTATVYVKGSKRGTFQAPGETVVFI